MKEQSSHEGWVVGAVLGGTALVGGLLLTIAAWPRRPSPLEPIRARNEPPLATPTFTEADMEAAARMLASENPRGSRALHIEQIHTQLRARKPGQSLFDRITAGSGWGLQGQSQPGGGIRPVSTQEPATPALRRLAEAVLAGAHPSVLPHARKFFEPAQQDRALAVAQRARKKQADGLALTEGEQRLLGYRRSAQEVRSKWHAEGAAYLGTIDGVEFFT